MSFIHLIIVYTISTINIIIASNLGKFITIGNVSENVCDSYSFEIIQNSQYFLLKILSSSIIFNRIK
jgi:hypothetical protein